ncbi:hypothetical protein D3C80_1914840 [compost metagenome]
MVLVNKLWVFACFSCNFAWEVSPLEYLLILFARVNIDLLVVQDLQFDVALAGQLSKMLG